MTYQTKKNMTKEVVYWLAQMKDCNTPVKLSNEHEGYKWVDINSAVELADRAKWPEMKEMLLAAEKYLRSHLVDSTTSTSK